MVNVFKAELMKAKKSRIFIVSALIVLLVPIFIVLKDLFLTRPPEHFMDWMKNGLMLNGIVLPIMSGFIITFLIQREYQDYTIINVLTAPVSKQAFITSKLFIWFLWYAIVLFAVETINIFGYFLIYRSAFELDGIKLFIECFTKSGLLSFVASLPLLWIAVKQRKMFYPTIILALGFTVIQLAGVNTSMEMIPFASAVPWSAVSIVSISEVQAQYKVICMASILISGVLGLLLSCFTFNRQDQ